MLPFARLAVPLQTVFCLAALIGCNPKNIPSLSQSRSEPFRAARLMMGTLIEITIFDPGEADSARVAADAFAEIREVDALMSTYKESSEISKINSGAAAQAMPMSEPTSTVLSRALHWAEESNGAFDPTVGPLVSYWRTCQQLQQTPSEEALRSVLSQVGYDKIRYTPKARQVRFTQKGLRLDFGGLAKGYAVDRAVQALRKAGVVRGLVNAGGDLFAFGPASITGIQHPLDSEQLLGAIELTDQAVATSGNYERNFEINGKRYGHIFDPRTGWPRDDVVSVTVTAKTAMDADALATAAFVMGPVEGLKLLNNVDSVEGMIVTLRAPDRLTFHKTRGFHLRR